MTLAKLLFVSSPVGALGSGIGGGVELNLYNIAQAMQQRGHTVEIVAPLSSRAQGIPVREIAGECQQSAQNQTRSAPISLPANSVLANMWDYVRQVQTDWDLIVNFAYDWLPLYLTPFLNRPVAHHISMGSLNDAMDLIIEQIATQFPGSIGVYTKTQAATFRAGDSFRCLYNGIDLSVYQFCPQSKTQLAWMGRIAPEKALEDAVAAAQISGIPLQVFGIKQDEAYWQQICQDYPDAPLEYRGFLPTNELQKELGQCQALLVTPRWVEAFGNVAIEALACGVPVIAYHRGGLTEIVREGKTGWLTQPDSVEGLVEAIGRIEAINRHDCRQQAQEEYSLQAMGDRYENWFRELMGTVS